jgi:zinc dependent phospholipase C
MNVKRICVVILLFVYAIQPCKAYSVLTHEAIIDANWENILLPLLKEKFPGSSAEALKEAHAYAYGGAVVPDMGYYPFGSKLFTNLIHYVRSGEFIEILFNNAQNINEFAFAAGVLCHYYADVYGHKLGINLSVPLIYPKMKKKYGDTVTFGENHISHVQTEFSFDVLQTARGNYASSAYHDFIGFQIAQSLLQRAFMETYGLDVNELFGNFPRAVARFRWTVINLLPFFTKAAWANKKSDIRKLQPTATSRSFIYRMRRKNYAHQFGEKEQPKFFAHVVSLFIQVIPKVGPLRVLNFESPTPQAERLFVSSFDIASTFYGNDITELKKKNAQLKNMDFDTGIKTSKGEYALADETYCKLVVSLKDKNFTTITPSLKQNILSFYADREGLMQTGQQKKAADAITELKMVQPVKEN